MNFKIREATTNDVGAITNLNKMELGYEYSVVDTAKKLEYVLASEKDKVLVAVVDDNVIGYIHANDYEVLYFPHMKNIMGIAVYSEYRKCGVGRALLDEVEKWAGETGAKGVRLVSGASRNGAHEFYRRCGYNGGKEQVNFKKML